MKLFETLTYKKKFYFLLLFTVILAMTAYKRSFSLTLRSHKDLINLESNYTFYKDNYKDINYLKQKSDYLNLILGQEKIEPELIQQKIFEFVSAYNSTKVISLKDIHIYKENNYIISTFELVVKSDYNNLSTLLYDYEKKFGYAKVVSYEYFVEENHKLNKNELYLKIYFQKYS
jgi:hypothetical protein